MKKLFPHPSLSLEGKGLGSKGPWGYAPLWGKDDRSENVSLSYERAKNFKEVKKIRKKEVDSVWRKLLWQLVPLTLGMFLVLLLLQSPVFAGDIENKLSTNDGSTAFEIQDSGDAGVAHIDSDGNLQIKDGMRLDSGSAECTTSENLIIDGNIGIGTTSPQGKPHIISDSTTDPYVFVTSHTISGFGIVVSTSGKVGIGTATLATRLEVDLATDTDFYAN